MISREFWLKQYLGDSLSKSRQKHFFENIQNLDQTTNLVYIPLQKLQNKIIFVIRYLAFSSLQTHAFI